MNFQMPKFFWGEKLKNDDHDQAGDLTKGNFGVVNCSGQIIATSHDRKTPQMVVKSKGNGTPKIS